MISCNHTIINYLRLYVFKHQEKLFILMFQQLLAERDLYQYGMSV